MQCKWQLREIWTDKVEDIVFLFLKKCSISLSPSTIKISEPELEYSRTVLAKLEPHSAAYNIHSA